jgi:hypothetical protein
LKTTIFIKTFIHRLDFPTLLTTKVADRTTLLMTGEADRKRENQSIMEEKAAAAVFFESRRSIVRNLAFLVIFFSPQT